MPFGKYGKSKLGDKALTLAQVKAAYPDYVKWLIEQDGFAEKNAALFAFFTGNEEAASTHTERKVIDEEQEFLTLNSPPAEFLQWWKTAFGERLRKQGEQLYIPYMRVALSAWNSGYIVGAATGRPITPPPAKPAPVTEEIEF